MTEERDQIIVWGGLQKGCLMKMNVENPKNVQIKYGDEYKSGFGKLIKINGE